MKHNMPRAGKKSSSAPKVAPTSSSDGQGLIQSGPPFSSSGILQMQQTLGNRSTGHVIQRSPSYKLPKKEGNEYDEYETTDYASDELAELQKLPEHSRKKDRNGKFTSVKADRNLPTFYGALKAIFGEKNVNEDRFANTLKVLGEHADRPHSVTAHVEKRENPPKRENGPLATAIGHFGKEELGIREGDDISRNMDYHGGHLVGYQVIGGEVADQTWNIAPQDADNNQFAYNNTIEEMVRSAEAGSEIEYTVELQYKSLNFAVDQNQLLSHGYIKSTDDSKPWVVQLPSRIPQHWEANAQLIGDQGKFGKPTKETNKEDGTKNKTYLQYSQEMKNDLSHEDKQHTARFMLNYTDKEGKEIKPGEVHDKINEVRTAKYRMHQEQATDRDQARKPDDWKGPDEADYGSVEREKVTAEKVNLLREDLEKEFQEFAKLPELPEVKFEIDDIFKKEVLALKDSDDKLNLIAFGIELDQQKEKFDNLRQMQQTVGKKRSHCESQKKTILEMKDKRRKIAEWKLDSIKDDELDHLNLDIKQTHTQLKRTTLIIRDYQQSVKKLRKEENELKAFIQSKSLFIRGLDKEAKRTAYRKYIFPVYGTFSSQIDKQEPTFFEAKVNEEFPPFNFSTLSPLQLTSSLMETENVAETPKEEQKKGSKETPRT